MTIAESTTTGPLPEPSEPDERAAVVAGLRQLADEVESGAIPIPSVRASIYPAYGATVADVARLLEQAGPFGPPTIDSYNTEWTRQLAEGAASHRGVRIVVLAPTRLVTVVQPSEPVLAPELVAIAGGAS